MQHMFAIALWLGVSAHGNFSGYYFNAIIKDKQVFIESIRVGDL